jgi:hypothetical protein
VKLFVVLELFFFWGYETCLDHVLKCPAPQLAHNTLRKGKQSYVLFISPWCTAMAPDAWHLCPTRAESKVLMEHLNMTFGPPWLDSVAYSPAGSHAQRCQYEIRGKCKGDICGRVKHTPEKWGEMQRSLGMGWILLWMTLWLKSYPTGPSGEQLEKVVEIASMFIFLLLKISMLRVCMCVCVCVCVLRRCFFFEKMISFSFCFGILDYW